MLHISSEHAKTSDFGASLAPFSPYIVHFIHSIILSTILLSMHHILTS